jgi:hypothetical protein
VTESLSCFAAIPVRMTPVNKHHVNYYISQ